MTSRRQFLSQSALFGTLAATSLLPQTASAKAQSSKPSKGRHFVLAHGSWHGGWCWQPVAELLRAQGHSVYTPSFSGMGDRAHLINKDINLDTFIEDLIQVIETEELDDVILVGHSFGGIPISGVADRIPEKLAHLVYFDAVILKDGQNAFSNYPKEEAEARIKAASEATNGLAVPIPKVLPDAWGLKQGSSEYAWVTRRLTPHPLASYTSNLKLDHPLGNGIEKTYISCTEPELSVLADSKKQVKEASDEWHWTELKAPHEAHITHPKALAEILLGVI